MVNEQKNLWAHLDEECCIINELRPRLEGKNLPADIQTDASWEQVLTAADRVAAEAITVGRLWTAENISDLRSRNCLVQNIKRLSCLVQKLIDVTIRMKGGACTDDRRKYVLRMVDVCVFLLQVAVFYYAIKKDRKGAGIPRLVNCVWHCLNHLKNPRLRDIEKRQPDAASPNESDQKKSGKRATFREFMITFTDTVKKCSPLKKGPSTQVTEQDFMDDDEVSVAGGFVASVEQVSRLNEEIEMLVQEFVRADIDTSGREDAFRDMLLDMREMADTLNQVVGGQKFSEELCQTDLMERIVTEFRLSSMHTSSPFQDDIF